MKRRCLACLFALLLLALTGGCGAADNRGQVLLVVPDAALDPVTWDAAAAWAADDPALRLLAVDEATAADADAYAAAVTAAVERKTRAVVLAPACRGAAAALRELRQSAGDELLLLACLPQEDTAALAAADIVLTVNDDAIPAIVAGQCVDFEASALLLCRETGGAADDSAWADAAAAVALPLQTVEYPAGLAGAELVDWLAAAATAAQTTAGGAVALLALDPAADPAVLTACLQTGSICAGSLTLDPYHAYPQAFAAYGVTLPDDLYAGRADYLAQIRKVCLEELFLSRHFWTWRAPLTTVTAQGAVAYAEDWAAGETEQRIDAAWLRQCLLKADAKAVTETDGQVWQLVVNLYNFRNNTNSTCNC